MILKAQSVYFLVDHSKFRLGGRELFLSLQGAGEYCQAEQKQFFLVTDRKPDEETAEAFRRQRITVFVTSDVEQL